MNLKKSIIEFNSELNRVEAGANLQFQVELSLEELQNYMLGDFESLENDSKRNKEEEEEFLEKRNEENAFKNSPLCLAFQNSFIEIIKLLFDHQNIDVNMQFIKKSKEENVKNFQLCIAIGNGFVV